MAVIKKSEERVGIQEDMGPIRCEVPSRIRILSRAGIEIRHCQMLGILLGSRAGCHGSFQVARSSPIIVSFGWYAAHSRGHDPVWFPSSVSVG